MNGAISGGRRWLAALGAAAITVGAPACGGSEADEESADAETTAATETSAADQTMLDDAMGTYDAYVENETAEFVDATEEFLKPVERGDVEAAKGAYPEARVHFERIEPVAGAFGDLDPDIDGREGDIPPREWGGYHRIEKALWIDESTGASRRRSRSCATTSPT